MHTRLLARVAAGIMKLAEKNPRALPKYLAGLVKGHRITQQTMDEILAMVAG